MDEVVDLSRIRAGKLKRAAKNEATLLPRGHAIARFANIAKADLIDVIQDTFATDASSLAFNKRLLPKLNFGYIPKDVDFIGLAPNQGTNDVNVAVANEFNVPLISEEHEAAQMLQFSANSLFMASYGLAFKVMPSTATHSNSFDDRLWERARIQEPRVAIPFRAAAMVIGAHYTIDTEAVERIAQSDTPPAHVVALQNPLSFAEARATYMPIAI